jgi:hypothetical protein
MKAAYLVTENAEAANFLAKILPPDCLQDVEIVSAGRKYAAVSLAGTIMSERSRPVMLVIDAESDDLAQAQEREQTLTGLLLPAAATAPYEVCVAMPALASLNQVPLNDEQIHALRQHPLIQRITQFLSRAFAQVA